MSLALENHSILLSFVTLNLDRLQEATSGVYYELARHFRPTSYVETLDNGLEKVWF